MAQLTGRRFVHETAPRRRWLAIRGVEIPADGDIDGIEPTCELKRTLQIGVAEDACPRFQIGVGDAMAALLRGQAVVRMRAAGTKSRKRQQAKKGWLTTVSLQS
jgi:hypothetical protein